MECLYFLTVSFLFAAILQVALPAASQTQIHESFLQCLTHSSNNSSISKVIYTQNNSSYSSVLKFSIHNLRFATEATPKPVVIVTPLIISHIQATVFCSRKHGLQIRIRSGGHDFEGLSYVSQVSFVVVDMIKFGSVDVDVKNKVAWVQSGAILGDIHYGVAEKSKTLAAPIGICHTVGTGGYFSGGGYGLLFRKYGLAVDNIIDAQLIDVNGRILDRKAMGEDLFWAIRGGGGGSFGIVVAWKLRLHPVPETVTVFTINKTAEQNAVKILHRWQYVANKLPDGTFFIVVLRSVNSSQDPRKNMVITNFRLFFLGRIDELVSLLRDRFPELGVVKEDCTEMSWIESILFFSRIQNKSAEILTNRTFESPLNYPASKSKSDYVQKPIPEIALKGLYSRLEEEEAKSSSIIFAAYGGIMDRIPANATPFPHRTGNLYKILYVAGWLEEENKQAQRYINWVRRLYSYMRPFVSKSPREAYINYRDIDIGMNGKGNTSYTQASVWGRKYFLDNFDKLVRVKKMIDPENFFRHEQSIPPVSS